MRSQYSFLVIAFVLVISGLVHRTAEDGKQKFLLFLQDSQGGSELARSREDPIVKCLLGKCGRIGSLLVSLQYL